MASMNQILAHVGANDRQGNIIPAHIFARRLQERNERQKRATSTIMAQAIAGETAGAPI
jgi:hypothetical protein